MEFNLWSHFLHLISSVSWSYRCSEVNAFSVCVCWESDRAHMCTHSTRGSLSGPSCSSVSLICLALRAFFLPSRTLEGPKKPVCYIHVIIPLQLSEEGTGLLSQQRTTHHFLLSSFLLGLITESKYSGAKILLVSQGRLLVQFPHNVAL